MLLFCPQLLHANTVEGLVLINIDPNAKGWMDWAAHKVRRGDGWWKEGVFWLHKCACLLSSSWGGAEN